MLLALGALVVDFAGTDSDAGNEEGGHLRVALGVAAVAAVVASVAHLGMAVGWFGGVVWRGGDC